MVEIGMKNEEEYAYANSQAGLVQILGYKILETSANFEAVLTEHNDYCISCSRVWPALWTLEDPGRSSPCPNFFPDALSAAAEAAISDLRVAKVM
jgi:hypothetical protein